MGEVRQEGRSMKGDWGRGEAVTWLGLQKPIIFHQRLQQSKQIRDLFFSREDYYPLKKA